MRKHFRFFGFRFKICKVNLAKKCTCAQITSIFPHKIGVFFVPLPRILIRKYVFAKKIKSFNTISNTNKTLYETESQCIPYHGA